MPVSSVKQRKAMKREQAIVHEALSSFFFDLQARATSEIAVADLNESENR